MIESACYTCWTQGKARADLDSDRTMRQAFTLVQAISALGHCRTA
jgi:hypothetical protein